MTPTTRYLCPLECGWHHDQTDPIPTPPAPGISIAEHAEKILTVEYAASETAVREHLESHPLIEWAREVVRLQHEVAGAVADREIAMEEWGKSDQHHAKKSVAMAAERGAWNSTRVRVWNAALVADEEDVTDWQRGYRACSARVNAALDEPAEIKLFDFNVPTATGCGFPPVKPRKAPPAVQQQVREQFGAGPEGYRDYLRAKHPVTLEDLNWEPDPSLPPNMEDCPQCVDPNPPYPWICPGHPTVASPTTDPEEPCPCCTSGDHNGPCTCGGTGCCCPGRHAEVQL